LINYNHHLRPAALVTWHAIPSLIGWQVASSRRLMKHALANHTIHQVFTLMKILVL